MSAVLTASDICRRALRMINDFPITESAASGESLREAMIWLDLIMAETAGIDRLFFLRTATLPITIVNGTQKYDLNTSLGANLPLDRVQFPIDAWLQDQLGNRTPIELVDLQQFESVATPTQTGPPYWLHIDRLPTPTLRVFPTPDVNDTNTYTIQLVVQTYAPNVAPGGVTGTQPSGSILTNFRQAWQRWLCFQLAHDLGSGPIIKLDEPSLTRFGAVAASSKTRLLAFENREHDTSPPICDPAWDFDDDCGDERYFVGGSSDYGNRLR
jgi:hypothetical protein